MPRGIFLSEFVSAPPLTRDMKLTPAHSECLYIDEMGSTANPELLSVTLPDGRSFPVISLDTTDSETIVFTRAAGPVKVGACDASNTITKGDVYRMAPFKLGDTLLNVCPVFVSLLNGVDPQEAGCVTLNYTDACMVAHLVSLGSTQAANSILRCFCYTRAKDVMEVLCSAMASVVCMAKTDPTNIHTSMLEVYGFPPVDVCPSWPTIWLLWTLITVSGVTNLSDKLEIMRVFTAMCSQGLRGTSDINTQSKVTNLQKLALMYSMVLKPSGNFLSEASLLTNSSTITDIEDDGLTMNILLAVHEKADCLSEENIKLLKSVIDM